MKTIRLFLASSKELKTEREHCEQEIGRKNKLWHEKGVFMHLDIWEDLSARLQPDGSQSGYNVYVRKADIFVLLAHTKVGMYTYEEFETAFGQFQATQKPFIFTYFKENEGNVDESLDVFKNKLSALGHFYSSFVNAHDLWIQFNKELDRLLLEDFERNDQNSFGGKSFHQQADKIYNIEKIDKADFS